MLRWQNLLDSPDAVVFAQSTCPFPNMSLRDLLFALCKEGIPWRCSFRSLCIRHEGICEGGILHHTHFPHFFVHRLFLSPNRPTFFRVCEKVRRRRRRLLSVKRCSKPPFKLKEKKVEHLFLAGEKSRCMVDHFICRHNFGHFLTEAIVV